MTEQIAIHCLKAIICEEVCEECELYGQTGTDHCEADAVRIAIEALEKQAEYKSLEEQGLLLRLPAPLDGVKLFSLDGKKTWFGLPCMAGDTIYRINKGAENPIIEMRVWQIYFKQLHKNKIVLRIDAINDEDMGESCYLYEDIGRKIFLTKEEAEAALEKMEGEERETD